MFYDPVTNFKQVDNFTLHPDPSDLRTNETFLALAQAEFSANRSGTAKSSWQCYDENKAT